MSDSGFDSGLALPPAPAGRAGKDKFMNDTRMSSEETLRRADGLLTAAVNDVKEDKDPYFAVLDIAGYNYAAGNYKPDHRRKPGRVMMGTEPRSPVR